MKQIRNALLILVLLCLLVVGVHAAEATTYRIDGMGITVQIPEGHAVFTNEIDEDDPNLGRLGLTAEFQMGVMEELNAYLSIWDMDAEYEILIFMNWLNRENFNDCTDEQLAEILAANKESDKDADTVEYYDHPQTKFLKSTYRSDGLCGAHYYTVYDNRDIFIILQSLTGSYDASMDTMLQEFIDNLWLEEGSSSTYILDEPGMAIEIPHDHIVYAKGISDVSDPVYSVYGFPVEDLSGDNTYIYASNMRDNSVFMVTGFDSAAAAVFHNASDAELFEIVDSISVLEKYGSFSDEPEICYYNQKKYVRFTLSSPSGEEGYYSIDYVTAHGGHLICIMLLMENGKYTPAQEAWLEEIVSNIQFFETASVEAGEAPRQDLLEAEEIPLPPDWNGSLTPSLKERIAEMSTIAQVYLVLFFTFVLCCLPVFVYCYIIRRTSVSKTNAVLAVIIYGLSIAIAALIAVLILCPTVSNMIAVGAGVLLGAPVNYCILTK